MSQSRLESFIEACTNTVIGFGINLVANIFFLPLVLGVSIHLGQNILLGLLFTVLSVIRGYVLRRFFNSFLALFKKQLARIIRNRAGIAP